MVKMVSKHCPVNVKVGDVIARVNGLSVLGMESKRVMEMFATLSKREKVIDILPSSGAPMASTPKRGNGAAGRHSPQAMRSKSVPRSPAPSRSRSRSQRRY